jgi:hypothetical protein
MGTPSNRTIIGVSILLFTCVLAGVGIHHLVKTGTCSSTGYSGDYGPVPYCPSGTGWWILFLMLGIFGSIIGGFIAGGSTVGLINGGIFCAIGFGSLTVVFDKHASSKAFAGVFGGAFALVGGIILAFVLASAFRSLRGGSTRTPSGSRPSGSTRIGRTSSAFGTPAAGGGSSAASAFGTSAASAFGTSGSDSDPILGAYAAGQGATPASTGLTGSGLSSSGLSDAGLSTAGAPKSSGVGVDLDNIAKLAELHKSGALTDEEFAAEKAKLLGS